MSCRVEIVQGSGETLTTFPFSACEVGVTGQEMRAVRRAALQEALAAALPPDCITYGARVVAVTEAAGSSGGVVRVRLQDGREEQCGLLIGADGTRSAVVDHLQLPGNRWVDGRAHMFSAGKFSDHSLRGSVTHVRCTGGPQGTIPCWDCGHPG